MFVASVFTILQIKAVSTGESESEPEEEEEEGGGAKEGDEGAPLVPKTARGPRAVIASFKAAAQKARHQPTTQPMLALLVARATAWRSDAILPPLALAAPYPCNHPRLLLRPRRKLPRPRPRSRP